MTLTSDQTLINTNLSSLKTKVYNNLVTKGVSSPNNTSLNTLADNILDISGGGGTYSEYTRPPTWLARPTFDSTNYDEFYMLFAVYDAPYNCVSLKATGTNLVLNWGYTGATDINMTSNTTYEININYADCPSSSYVTDRGYRQVWIKVSAPRGSMTGLILHQSHSAFTVASSCNYLEILGNYSSISTLTLGATTKLIKYSLLESVILTGTHTATNITGLFANMSKVQYIDYNFSGKTNISSVMINNSCLKYVTINNTVSSVGASSAFSGCSALREIYGFTPNTISSVSSMHLNNYSLEELPNYGNMNGTLSSTFQNLYSLLKFPAVNFSGLSSTTTPFSSLTSLQEFNATGMAQSFSLAGSPLNDVELNNVFTNLATVTSKTITITGCPGASTCNRTIATAKGWTVTG